MEKITQVLLKIIIILVYAIKQKVNIKNLWNIIKNLYKLKRIHLVKNTLH
jgi:hypothetical protein